MNEYKKYLLVLIFSLLIFLGLNYYIFARYTARLLIEENGDLARIGYISDAKHNRENVINLPMRHLEYKEIGGKKIDILTIGDSFSQGGGGGENQYYQDYIATVHKRSILNLPKYMENDEITTVTILNNSGFLIQLGIRYLLIEIVERRAIKNLTKRINFKAAEKIEVIQNYYGKKVDNGGVEKPYFINSGNFRFVMYGLLYKYSENAFMGKVYVTELSRPMFSGGDGRKLLFYSEDIESIPLCNGRSIRILNDNLNQLSGELKKNGIRLFFMPVVDKYNLFSEFIIHNKYEKSYFFEELRKLPRNYFLIDTKEILIEEVRRGEKDIFYVDDTHWTWKASKKIVENLQFD